MRLMLLNAAHAVLQNQCISGDNRTVLLLGRHNQLRCGPTLTVNDTITAPPITWPGSSVETIAHCFQELEAVDCVVGCAFVVHDELHVSDVSDRSKEFLLALRKYFVAKGVADVEKSMMDKASKLVFISMWCGVVKAELRQSHTCCLKTSILCHRVIYSENLLGPEEREEKNGDDVQFIGTTGSAAKRARRSVRTSDGEFSHIKSQEVDLRVWSGEGSSVHELDFNFPAFNMPVDDAGSSGKLQGVFNRMEKNNTELHADILVELEYCQQLARRYSIDYERRQVLPAAISRKAAAEMDSALRPS